MSNETLFELSSLEATDCEAIALIHAECFLGQAWSKEAFEEFFGSNKHWGRLFGWMALKGGVPCGFILARMIVQECEILTFAVKPSFQGKGIGRLLLNCLLQEVTVPIFLEVATDNLPAIGLYESVGFEVLTVRHNYYEGSPGQLPRDAYLMRHRPMGD